jgi:outer membrane receptor protein involved in Fe transport
VSYNITPKLSASFEGINVTDETSRSHGRTQSMVDYATQTGPRWMAGLRYKF